MNTLGIIIIIIHFHSTVASVFVGLAPVAGILHGQLPLTRVPSILFVSRRRWCCDLIKVVRATGWMFGVGERILWKIIDAEAYGEPYEIAGQ